MANPLEWRIFEDQQFIEVRHSNDDAVEAHSSKNLLAELVITITAQLVVPADAAYFETLFRDEQAMGRALTFNSVALTVGNILGGSLKLRLSDWTPAGAKSFPLRRLQSWNFGQQAVPPGRPAKVPPVFGSGDPPEELLETEGIRHRDRKIVSLINIPLWDKAGWNGAGFIEHPNPRVPPLLALIFADKDAGEKIFAAWRREIGPHDENCKLRITIITGIDRRSPAHYRMIIGANADWDTLPKGSHFVMVSRILTMKPTTSVNLERFLEKYRRDGKFFIAAGHVERGDDLPSVDPQLAIFTTQLNVRPAWEIGENDPDVIGIHEDDDVAIPNGVIEPPILRTLERIKKRRRRPTSPEPSNSSVQSQTKTGRNDPCPCNSGKKFKKCHGK